MNTSFFFNSNNGLDRYKTNTVIQGLLGRNFVLLNFDEFLNWYMPAPDKTSSRGVTSKYSTTPAMIQSSTEKKQSAAREVLPKLASLCRDIDETYGADAVKDLFISNKTFDLFVAVLANYENVRTIGNVEKDSQRKLDYVCAFIIVQLAECQRKPNTVSVKLICGKPLSFYQDLGIPQFKAYILLGAYLYCIKNTTYDQLGILELAGGYTNPAGFMSYTKLGFNYDKSLTTGVDCFDDIFNLPMSVNLVKMTPETIINLVGDVTERRIDNIDDPTMLYKLKPYKNTKANELILLQNISNILYRLELGTVNGKSAISHYTNKTPSTNIYLNPIEKQLINEYMTNLSSVSGKINVQTLTNFMNDKKDRVIEAIGVNCKDGTCSSTIRCINGICNFLGKPDAFGGKHKTRRHKTRRHKTRKHKTRKYKTRKHKRRK
jgi:hypothetical protein